MKRILLLAILFVVNGLPSFSQSPPKVFFDGLDNYSSNPSLAKQLFIRAIQEDSAFFGSYNFLGTILDQEMKYDSAISCLQLAVKLNPGNVNQTREMTLEHLCRTFLHSGNFEEAYNTAINSLNEFPGNKYLLKELSDICLWAYNTEYGGLSKEYLHPEIKPEFFVNSVSQEYLIMRNITINNQNLSLVSQSYNPGKNTDLLTCSVKGEKENRVLTFKLGWDVLKTFGDSMPDYKIVYDDKNANIWSRIGAILMHERNTDILKEIRKLQN